MKRPTMVLVLLLASICLTQALNAAEIGGSWSNQQWGASMTLNQDGTYTFKTPAGQSTGRWVVRGQSLWLQDTWGQTMGYSIEQLSQSELSLKDSNGKPLVFIRPRLFKGEILLRKGGLELTSEARDLNSHLVAFMIDKKLTKAEQTQLRKTAKDDFNQDPQTFLNQAGQLKKSLDTIARLQDVTQIGAVRQALLVAFHRASLKLKPSQQPLALRIINRHQKVVAFDSHNNLVLTDRDIKSALAYLRFSNMLAGQDFKITPALEKEFTQSTLAAFPKMDLAQKHFFCSASLALKLVENNWKRLSKTQRAQLKNEYLRRRMENNKCRQAKGQTAQPSPKTDPGIQFPPGWHKMSKAQKRAHNRKKMRSNMARQSMFQTMQNTATQNHATMLNTIENFGGSGRYWEVVDQ